MIFKNDIFVSTTQMDPLCEPVEVNRMFIKMIDEVIQPEYERVLQEIFDLLKQDIDSKLATTVQRFCVET